MFDIISLVVGFVPLFWGASILVNGSSALVKRTGVSNFSIGLTIVAFGTSTPEMSVNIFAAFRHDNFITMGNILGSNMFNVAVILGIIALLFPIVVQSKVIKIEVLIAFIAGVVILIFANDKRLTGDDFNVVSRKEGLFLLFLFLIYLVFLIRNIIKRNAESELGFTSSGTESVVKIAMGLGLLIAGGQLIVFSAQNLSDYLNISERVIAIVFISIGTSLPELATAIMAARKGNTELIVGNLIGSNIFNGFFVLGISALINPIRISSGIRYDIVVHFLVNGLLLVFLLGKPGIVKKLNGALLVLIYLSYILYLLFFLNH